MPIESGEIIPGVVAILDGSVLVSDPEVITAVEHQVGMRPFVCVRVEGDNSIWLEVTTRWSKPRLCLNEWKVPGSEKWMNDNQYLQDARYHFSGPKSSFVAASAGERPHQPHVRPSINAAGINAISAEIRKYNAPWF